MAVTKLFFLLLFSCQTIAQTTLVSGKYREMKIAYDKETNYVTGYYLDGTGYDEETRQSKFSCIFYLEGKLVNKKANIKTYYPKDTSQDVITGEFRLINNKEFEMLLPEEHGGCWNVEHFAGEPDHFTLSKPVRWIQVRYVTKEKAYFHSDKSDISKRKAYLVKGDVVYVEKIEGQWVFCTYDNEKNVTKGWIRSEDINQLN